MGLTIRCLYSNWPSKLLLDVLQRASFHALAINHRYYCSSHVFDSRGNKRKTKPQRVFMMEHGASICLYFKPGSGTLVVRVNAHVFWLITLPLYHFSPSPCIYALPQQLLCSFSRRPLLPLSISLARSINTMRILAVSLKGVGGDFSPRCSFAEIESQHGCETVKHGKYISLLFSYRTTEESVFNEYYQSHISKMSEGVRKPHCF